MHANSDENSFWRVCPKSSSEQSGYTINVFVSTFSPGRRRNKNKQTRTEQIYQIASAYLNEYSDWSYEKIKIVWTHKLFGRVRASSDLVFAATVTTLIIKQTFVRSDEFVRNRQNEFSSEFAGVICSPVTTIGATATQHSWQLLIEYCKIV